MRSERAALASLVAIALWTLGCESRVSLGARCATDGECGALRCDYGRCRAACTVDGDCGGELVCNQGVCAERDESCSSGSGCLHASLACADTICAPRCDTAPCPSAPSSACAWGASRRSRGCAASRAATASCAHRTRRARIAGVTPATVTSSASRAAL